MAQTEWHTTFIPNLGLHRIAQEDTEIAVTYRPSCAEQIVRDHNSRDALVKTCLEVALLLERASLVQNRSVHIIKQTCTMLAKKLRTSLDGSVSET